MTAALLVVSAGSVASSSAGAAPRAGASRAVASVVPPAPITRMSGPDRYATAVAVSTAHTPTPDAKQTVFIATGVDFPDALSVGWALDKPSGDGTLLFTTPTVIPAVTATELERLRPASIVVVGGPGVISDSVVSALKAYTAGTVTRLAGTDRYATAAAISRTYALADLGTTYIATGTDFADALSAGPLAARDGNMLLTSPTALPAATVNELERTRPTYITVVGGAGAVSDAVLTALRRYSSNVSRVAGVTRYDTNESLINSFGGQSAGATIATGMTFPDALAAGTLGHPIVLSSASSTLSTTRNALYDLVPRQVALVGGTGALSDSVHQQISDMYTSISAAPSNLQVTRQGVATLSVSWTNPPDPNFGGIALVRKEGPTAPTSTSDGVLVIDTALSPPANPSRTTYTDTGLSSGATYSYAAFSHNGLLWTLSTPTTMAATTALPATLRSISAGALAACAITTAAHTFCWGYPFTTQPQPLPGADSSLLMVSESVPSVTSEVCAVFAAGSVQCWHHSTRFTVAGLPASSTVAAGMDHSCALTTSQQLYCWGVNTRGQLGTGDTSSPPDAQTAVKVSALGAVAQVDTGGTASCAVSTSGAVACWGDTDSGVVPASPSGAAFNATPTVVPGLESGASQVDVGFDHACALTTLGRVLCWGQNAHGQLGDGTRIGHSQPVAVSLPASAMSVSDGTVTSCALLTGAQVWCWGTGAGSLFGTAQGPDSLTPQHITAADGAKSISLGGPRQCILDADDHGRCWGYSPSGDGSNKVRDTPTLIDVPVGS